MRTIEHFIISIAAMKVNIELLHMLIGCFEFENKNNVLSVHNWKI